MDIPIVVPRKVVVRRRSLVIGISVLGVLAIVSALWPSRHTVLAADVQWARASQGGGALPIPAYGAMSALTQKLLVSPVPAVVEEIVAPAGTSVARGDLILRLSSPRALEDLAKADSNVQKAQVELKESLLTQRMDSMAEADKLKAAESEALLESRQSEAMRPLADKGIVSKFEMLRQESKIATLRLQVQSQHSRTGLVAALDAARVSARQDAVAQAELLRTGAQQNVDALAIRATMDGPVQDVFVSLGQSVLQGEKLAQIADASRLVAALKVPQTHASRLTSGAPVILSVMGHPVRGRIVRVDPKVKDGAVVVDVEPQQALPAGVRVAQAVSGDIQLTAEADTIFLPRRNGMVPYAKATVYVRVGEDLVPREIQFGAASETQIEVVSGLSAGEDVAANVQPTSDAAHLRIER